MPHPTLPARLSEELPSSREIGAKQTRAVSPNVFAPATSQGYRCRRSTEHCWVGFRWVPVTPAKPKKITPWLSENCFWAMRSTVWDFTRSRGQTQPWDTTFEREKTPHHLATQPGNKLNSWDAEFGVTSKMVLFSQPFPTHSSFPQAGEGNAPGMWGLVPWHLHTSLRASPCQDPSPMLGFPSHGWTPVPCRNPSPMLRPTSHNRVPVLCQDKRCFTVRPHWRGK